MTAVMENAIRSDFRKSFGIDIEGEGKGSTALAQMIRSGLARPDVFISASPSVNDQVLMGDSNQNLVSWYLALAKDQLVIAYSPKSRFAKQLESVKSGQVKWYSVLAEPGFRLGRTDPLLDPKGVNTLFLFQLASSYYHQPDLGAKILGSDENPSQVFPEETLLAQVDAGQIDAIIAYKHEAVEWNMPYLELPDAINLGSETMADAYAKAGFQTKNGKTEKGAPIVFTITIPKTSANRTVAVQFLKYMVSGNGHNLLMKDGFTALNPKTYGNQAAVPAELKGN